MRGARLRGLGLAAGLGLAGGCFSDGFLEGRPCTDDSECGSLGCNDGFCGSAPADAESGGGEADTQATAGDGDGDSGDGDGDGVTGDGDGDGFTGDGDGDGFTGDGDGFTGDGDGDGFTGDGDGDGTTGDGDGTTGDGDGDGSSGTTGDGDGTSGTTGDGDGTSGTTGDGDGTSGTTGDGDGDGTSGTTGDGDGTSGATGDGDGDGTSGATGDGDGTSGATGDGDGTTGDGDGSTGDGDGTTGDGDGETCLDCAYAIDPTLEAECMGDPPCSCVVDCATTQGQQWYECVNTCGMSHALAKLTPHVYEQCDTQCPGVLNPDDTCELCDQGACVGQTGCLSDSYGPCACVAMCDLSDQNSTWFDCLGTCNAFGTQNFEITGTEACLRVGCEAECGVGPGGCLGDGNGCLGACAFDTCQGDADCDCVTRCIDFDFGDWDTCEGFCGADRATNTTLQEAFTCALQSGCSDPSFCDIIVPEGLCVGCLVSTGGCDTQACEADAECGCLIECLNGAELATGVAPILDDCISSCPGVVGDAEAEMFLQCAHASPCDTPMSCDLPDMIWETTWNGSASGSYDEANSVDIDSSGTIYVVGTKTEFQVAQGANIHFVQYDPFGVENWSVTYDGGASGMMDVDAGTSVDVNPSGTRIAVGGVSDAMGIMAGFEGLYDNFGNPLYEGVVPSSQWTAPNDQPAFHLGAAINNAGDYLFFGGFEFSVTFDENALLRMWNFMGGSPMGTLTRLHDADATGADRHRELAYISPGGADMVVAAGYGETTLGGNDATLRVVERSMGMTMVDRVIDVNGGDNGLDCVDAVGNALVVGGWATAAGNGRDFWLRKYTLQVSPMVDVIEDWTRTWDAGGLADDELSGCGIDSTGAIVVSGWSTSGSGYLRKYSPAGVEVWTRVAPSNKTPLDLAIAENDDIVVVGRDSSTDDDGWVARFRP